MGAGKTINNPNKAISGVNNTVEIKGGHLIFDFSSPTAWKSYKTTHVNSFLTNEKDFVKHFRAAQKVVRDLSEKTFNEVFNDFGRHQHCHLISEDDKRTIVLDAVKSEVRNYEQVLESEPLYQVGFDKGVRLIGTVTGNVLFRVFFVDYNHDVYPDEKKNRNSKKHLKFCPMNSS